MKHLLLASLASIVAGLSPGGAGAADLDDGDVTRETIIEERPVTARERVTVRSYVEPRDSFDEEYYDDDPRIGVVAGPYWGGRWFGHPRGWRGVGWPGRHHW